MLFKMDDENRDNTMSIILTRKLVKIVFCIGLAFSSPVSASDDEYICEAKQNSDTELPVLSKNCPIGQGLWGATPIVDDGLFWIQCGLFNDAKTIKQALPIYNVISTDVWLKSEANGYRCLVGPYEKFSVAQTDLTRVKRLDSYKESFIRNATTKMSPSMMVEKAKEVSKPKEKVSTSLVAPVLVDTIKPKLMSKPQAKVTEKVLESGDTVVARRDVKIGEKYYAIPYLMDGDEQYYMEYGIAWNRLGYERAVEVCRSQQMRLPSGEEWKTLIDSQIMSKKQWPLHLPYWGEGKHGLFTSGKVNQLKGTSLLNVVCVK